MSVLVPYTRYGPPLKFSHPRTSTIVKNHYPSHYLCLILIRECLALAHLRGVPNIREHVARNTLERRIFYEHWATSDDADSAFMTINRPKGQRKRINPNTKSPYYTQCMCGGLVPENRRRRHNSPPQSARCLETHRKYSVCTHNITHTCRTPHICTISHGRANGTFVRCLVKCESI